jgi:hypothetical protein
VSRRSYLHGHEQLQTDNSFAKKRQNQNVVIESAMIGSDSFSPPKLPVTENVLRSVIVEKTDQHRSISKKGDHWPDSFAPLDHYTFCPLKCCL